MIRIICVGKLKEHFLKEAMEEYLKRLQKYTKLEVIEVPDEGMDDFVVVLRKEREKIEKYLSSNDFLITLEISGKQFSSLDFAEKLEELQMRYGNITFLIGGSYGLDLELRKRSNLALSFSEMTFPHQLFRILLLEQIYRAFKIQNHESYHK